MLQFNPEPTMPQPTLTPEAVILQLLEKAYDMPSNSVTCEVSKSTYKKEVRVRFVFNYGSTSLHLKYIKDFLSQASQVIQTMFGMQLVAAVFTEININEYTDEVVTDA
jgi:hypothetical protein